MGAAHSDACLFCASPHPAGDSEQQRVALSDADKRSVGLEWETSHPTITATTPRRRGLGLGALQRQPTQQRESERASISLSSLRVTGLACEQHSESNNHLIVRVSSPAPLSPLPGSALPLPSCCTAAARDPSEPT